MFSGENLNFDEMFKLLRDHSKTIIELGANNGSTSIELLRRMWSDDILYCIEPDPRCILKHKHWVKDPRCILVQAAINNINGDVNFHLCTSTNPSPTFSMYGPWDCASSMKKIGKDGLRDNPWLRYDKDVIIPGITLDTFTEEYNIDQVNFIHCDVEGNYGEVIEGGKQTLSRTKYFYTEYSIDQTYEGELMYDGLLNLMEGLNWKLVYKFEHDVLFRNKALTTK